MKAEKRILIAEDDTFIRTLLEAQCTGLGMQCHVVGDGAQAVTEALSYQYDVILTDIQMPVCDGIAAMQMLRRLGYDRPIFAMSADEIDEDGFDQVLHKPVNIQALAQLLQQTQAQPSVALVLDSALTALFYQNLHQLSQEFAQALHSGQREKLQQICHKIKGGAASFGEMALSDTADSLQRLLASAKTMPELMSACQEFATQLTQFGDQDA